MRRMHRNNLWVVHVNVETGEKDALERTLIPRHHTIRKNTQGHKKSMPGSCRISKNTENTGETDPTTGTAGVLRVSPSPVVLSMVVVMVDVGYLDVFALTFRQEYLG